VDNQEPDIVLYDPTMQGLVPIVVRERQ